MKALITTARSGEAVTARRSTSAMVMAGFFSVIA
jgi:hypothetical protein